MDGSSTETEDPQHFEKAKPKKRAVKKDLPAKKRTKRNDLMTELSGTICSPAGNLPTGMAWVLLLWP